MFAVDVTVCPMRILDVVRDPTTSPEFSTAPELRRDHLGPILLLFPC